MYDDLGKPLTKRELEVVNEAKKMLTNRQIADILCVSDHTVKAHIANAIHKLGAKNRYDAAIIASKLGLIDL
ncbi:MAG: helix-turn-helix transcriptional regulator [Muribaculaceae bacterium]|nr:helix-turn-helix transcriptional regulator [Muribaculaceae bacterium]